MSNTRVRCHPTLGVLVCTDGHILVPQNGANKAHWYYGSPNHQGYLQVRINGSIYKVHRLIAETFIPNPENKKEIDHINRDPQDNRVENLRWATRQENCRNTKRHDKCGRELGVHLYEDERAYNAARSRRQRASEPQRWKGYNKKYWASQKQFVKAVLFSDGATHKVRKAIAESLLGLPVKDRVFNADMRYKPTVEGKD